MSERPRSANIEAAFAGNRGFTDELLALYLAGKKHAGSSIVEDFLTAGDPSKLVATPPALASDGNALGFPLSFKTAASTNRAVFLTAIDAIACACWCVWAARLAVSV